MPNKIVIHRKNVRRLKLTTQALRMRLDVLAFRLRKVCK